MWKSIFAVALLFGLGNGLCRAQNIELVGQYSYSVNFNTNSATVNISEIDNPTPYMTGSLRIELWLSDSPYNGGQLVGTRIFSLPFSQFSGAPPYGQLAADTSATGLSVTGPMAALPSPGTYYVTVVVSEYTENCGTSDGYCIETWGGFQNELTVPAFSPIFDPGSTSSGGGGALGGVSLALLALLLAFERARNFRRCRRE
ncbi:MAG: hypothetical protein M0038_22695 [Pseudomonadota bacterium]|jgi:hypothetical protein|nr:hypothetical protein [Pseudomonadota bacterium]